MDKAATLPNKQYRKTEMCRNWEAHKDCPHYRKGNCAFAHGLQEMQSRARPQNYKTEICYRYWESAGPPGCPFGKRCRFIHNLEEANIHRLPVFNGIATGE
jgi:hypothetical protein